MIEVEVHFPTYHVSFRSHCLLRDITRLEAYEGEQIVVSDVAGKAWVFATKHITHITAKEVTPE